MVGPGLAWPRGVQDKIALSALDIIADGRRERREERVTTQLAHYQLSVLVPILSTNFHNNGSSD